MKHKCELTLACLIYPPPKQLTKRHPCSHSLLELMMAIDSVLPSSPCTSGGLGCRPIPGSYWTALPLTFCRQFGILSMWMCPTLSLQAALSLIMSVLFYFYFSFVFIFLSDYITRSHNISANGTAASNVQWISCLNSFLSVMRTTKHSRITISVRSGQNSSSLISSLFMQRQKK